MSKCYAIVEVFCWKNEEKSCKNIAKKFGDYEKSRTFALPFEKRVADEAESSWKDWRMDLIAEKFSEKSCRKIWRLKNNAYLCSPDWKRGLERETEKFIEKTEYCTRSKYREKQFIEKR